MNSKSAVLANRPWIHEINRSNISVKLDSTVMNEGACGPYGYEIVRAGDGSDVYIDVGSTSVSSSTADYDYYSEYGSLSGHQGYIYAIPDNNNQETYSAHPDHISVTLRVYLQNHVSIETTKTFTVKVLPCEIISFTNS